MHIPDNSFHSYEPFPIVGRGKIIRMIIFLVAPGFIILLGTGDTATFWQYFVKGKKTRDYITI
jgi:hypothetical protein